MTTTAQANRRETIADAGVAGDERLDRAGAGVPAPVDNRRGYVSVAIIVVATLVQSTAMGMCAIVFPLTLQSFGASTSFIGVVMSLETGASLVMCLLLPRVLRRIGMRAGLVLSTVLRVPPLILLAFTTNTGTWVVLVFVNALGAFTFLILLQTWVNSIPFRKNRGLMVALYSTSISSGLALGPVAVRLSDSIWAAVAPVLGAAAGVDTASAYRFTFFLAAFASATALLPVLGGLLLVPAFHSTGQSRLLGVIGRAKGPMFAVAMGGVSLFGISAFITLYGTGNGLSVGDSALLLTCFMAGSLLLEAPLTSLSDRFDRRYVIVGAAFASMVCAVCLPLAIYYTYQAWALLFVWGGVVGTVYSTSLALVGDEFAGDDLVAANAGYSLMDAAGGSVGIVAIGFCMDVFGGDGLPYVIMFASILYFSFALTRYEVV